MEALNDIRPGAQWSLNGDSYNGLVWLDNNQTKPTVTELRTAKALCLEQEEARKQEIEQAYLCVKSTAPTDARLNAVIKIMGLDK